MPILSKQSTSTTSHPNQSTTLTLDIISYENCSLNNPPDHPISSQAPRPQPGGCNLRSPLACFIVFRLRCDIEKHHPRALGIIDVASYIEEEHLVRFHETTPPQDQRTYTRSSGASPLRSRDTDTARSDRIVAFQKSSPRRIVTVVQKIITMVVAQ